jgi:hypothetical protein
MGQPVDKRHKYRDLVLQVGGWTRTCKKLRGLSLQANYTGEVSAHFAGRGCYVISVPDPYGRILGFLDRSLYFFFLAAPQLYLRG